MGGKGSGGGGVSIPSVNVQPSAYEEELANIAKGYYGQTQPLRNIFTEDFQNFLRPPTSSTTTTTGTTTTGGGNTAGFSPNFSTPSQSQIMEQLRYAYGGMEGGAPYSQANEAAEKLAGWGLDYGDSLNSPYFHPPSEYVNGVYNPDFQNWMAAQAGDIRNNALQKQVNSMQQATPTTTTTTTPASSGLTSSNLYNPYNLPGYAPLYQLARTGLESQYNPARQNIMASTPRGGALASNLANLEISRAQQAGSLPATIAAPLITDIYNKAYGMATGAPQVAIAGLSAADSGYTSQSNAALSASTSAAMQQAALNQQSSAATSQLLGSGLGSLAGMGVKAAMK